MLKIYLVSVVIWLIILITTSKFTGEIIRNKDIDYTKYINNKSKTKLNFLLVSFIPIIRLAVWGVMIYLIGADEKSLDKLLNNK